MADYAVSELRLVLLGNNWSLKASVGNLLLGKTEFTEHDKCVKGKGTIQDKGAGKTSAVKSILDQPKLCEASPGQCLKHEGEVCGRRVSLVELPPLSGKPLETVKQLCLNCISLCAPEGVHAFILVLSGPLTHKDKVEVEILQKTLSARVRDFTVGLISVESDAAVDSRKSGVNLEELGQICGGGALSLNIRDPQKVTELMDTVDKLTQGGARAYTKDMFLEALIEEAPKSPEINLSLKSLRIALIGKRSRAIANTILGVKHFPLIQPKAICEKVSRMVHGRTVTMLITPPLYNDSFSDEQLSKCVSELSPGPHVYLLLLPIGNIDKQDKDSLQLIKKRLREKVADYVFIIFTKGNVLDEDYTIENYIEECDDSVKDILNECKSRYHVLNNKTETNRTQVAELLDKIDKMTQENSCNYFTKEMLKMKEAQMKNKEMEDNNFWLKNILYAFVIVFVAIFIKHFIQTLE